MNKKNNKKAQQSIIKLRNTLINELSHKSIKEITITYLCLKSNINRTTFYAHYDTVEDILYEICEENIFKVYNVFLKKDIDYKEKIKQSILIIKDNLKSFKLFFKYVHDIEHRILDILSVKSNVNLNLISLPVKLNLVYRISGFMAIGKFYLDEIENNPNIKISINELTDIIYNSINTKNIDSNFLL